MTPAGQHVEGGEESDGPAALVVTTHGDTDADATPAANKLGYRGRKGRLGVRPAGGECRGRGPPGRGRLRLGHRSTGTVTARRGGFRSAILISLLMPTGVTVQLP